MAENQTVSSKGSSYQSEGILGLDICPNGMRFVDVSYGDEGPVLISAGSWGIAVGAERGRELTNLRKMRVKDALSGLLDVYNIVSKRASIAAFTCRSMKC